MLLDKIVVVDDDPRIRKSLSLALNQYNLISFSDGQEAISYLQKPNEVRLVILDVYMSGMNGISVLTALKKIDENIAVIMMSGYATKDVAIEALRHHADDFIEKPFDVEVLQEKIKVILRQKSYQTTRGVNKDEKVERIKRFLEKNRAMVSLKEISKELCLSPKYVSRMFRKKAKKSFRQYKLNQRIKIAKSLLVESSFNINQIAEKLGYQNAESFMKIFKKFVGLTPKKFREAQQASFGKKSSPGVGGFINSPQKPA